MRSNRGEQDKRRYKRKRHYWGEVIPLQKNCDQGFLCNKIFFLALPKKLDRCVGGNFSAGMLNAGVIENFGELLSFVSYGFFFSFLFFSFLFFSFLFFSFLFFSFLFFSLLFSSLLFSFLFFLFLFLFFWNKKFINQINGKKKKKGIFLHNK